MKELLKVTVGLVLFIALTIGLLTTARNINRQPSVILTDMECEPPCWNNIQPGQTTSYQAYAILDQSNDVDKDTIQGEYNHKQELIKIFWFFQRPVEDQMGSVKIEQDRASAINITTVNSLKLADLFNKLGEPQEYWAGIGKRESGEEYLDIVLLSPSKGYAAEILIDTEYGMNQVEVTDSTPVFRVTYFSPEMYPELLKTKILIDKTPNRRTPSRPWSGFGPIPFSRE